ncbi:MAG: AmmeMemoRadiSam system radical SAM enzyme [Candidatus Cloacimonetes bacterium]|nr:AmmeMemoRadiSam system radical SAM enzyme [Candidatus Cloacimonadota bacterium]
MQEAKYYQTGENSSVQCLLCPHYCFLKPEELGRCRGRKNISGKLYAINYAKTISISIDPMEKKPLYHFYPGEKILSIGPNSCNLSCDFCQNYQISQYPVKTQSLTPGELLDVTRKHLCRFVAYTYTEPVTWFEYVLESARLLKENGIGTVLVTNGYINEEPLLELLPYIDAMNVDLKSMDSSFYLELCGARLQPVLKTIELCSGKCVLEITNLLVTDQNDSETDIRRLVDFIAGIDPDIPVHFSRYFPNFKRNDPPTSEQVLETARKIALEKLSYVYLGNMVADRNTYCPECGELVIRRELGTEIKMTQGRCSGCGLLIYGKFDG